MPARSTAAPDTASLYVLHHGWLLGWLRRRLDCKHDAADLAQDTFLRILGRPSAPAPTEPRAYLATIARGLVIDLHRRHALERAYLDAIGHLPPPAQPGPEERALALEALCAIDRMLDGLKPVVRETFLLSQLEGLTYAQIAQRLDISLRSVNNHMVSALQRCWDAL